MTIRSVEVTVTGEFGKEGEPGSNICYKVQVMPDHSQDEITALIEQVDKVAEIHNTLRKGATVTFLAEA